MLVKRISTRICCGVGVSSRIFVDHQDEIHLATYCHIDKLSIKRIAREKEH